MRQYDVDFKGVGKDRPGQKSLKKEKSGELKTEMTMAETENFLELLRNHKKMAECPHEKNTEPRIRFWFYVHLPNLMVMCSQQISSGFCTLVY